jgi:hypothetical protein
MAENHMVRCSTKQRSPGASERITHVGGTNSDGTAWKMSEGDAVAGIKSGKLKFYVNVDAKGVWLVVAQREGRDYLKSEADDVEPNLLLALPECP